jgi:hypothetical protein
MAVFSLLSFSRLGWWASSRRYLTWTVSLAAVRRRERIANELRSLPSSLPIHREVSSPSHSALHLALSSLGTRKEARRRIRRQSFKPPGAFL